MLISPILNSYIEKYDRCHILNMTVFFIVLEFWFDCILHNDRFGFTQGYSVIHFCVIYIMGRLLALYKDTLLKVKIHWWGGGFFVCCFVISVMHVIGFDFTFNYSNPVVIFSAICSFVPFLYFKFYSKFINWIASGAFAVYVIQIVDPIYHALCDYDAYLLANNPYMVYLIKGLAFCIIFFILCVLYDKLRDYFSSGIVNRINKIYERSF